ncbi:MAG: hypothetical protein Q7T86_12765 [Hyphomicrobiaceae bacterium]|nr:hypothetical protein [Hyphomicrobiaceae bacterium]
MDTQWFLTRNGETIAQYSTEQFKRAVAKRVLRPTDYVRRSDSSTLISAAEFLPPTYTPRSAVPRVLGGLFAIAAVLGGIGYGVTAIAPALRQSIETLDVALENIDSDRDPQAAIRQATLRQVLLSDSTAGGFFVALSQKDPAAFEELVAQFSDSLATETPDEVVPKVRAYLMKAIIEPRSRYLPDEDKAAMLTLNRDMSVQLAGTNPKMCLAHALAKPFGDMRAYVTPELKAREEQLMLRMLDAQPQTFDLLPAKELQALNTKVGTSLYEKHGDEINLLDLENVAEGKEEAACRMFAAYLDGVLTLPDAERIALVRAMMLQPGLLAEDATAQQATPQDGSATGEAAPAEATVAQPDAMRAPNAEPAPVDDGSSADQTATPEPSADPPAADADTAADAQAQ